MAGVLVMTGSGMALVAVHRVCRWGWLGAVGGGVVCHLGRRARFMLVVGVVVVMLVWLHAPPPLWFLAGRH
jgi:hypothetical protein